MNTSTKEGLLEQAARVLGAETVQAAMQMSMVELHRAFSEEHQRFHEDRADAYRKLISVRTLLTPPEPITPRTNIILREKVIITEGSHAGKVGTLLEVNTDWPTPYTHRVRFRTREYWFMQEHVKPICRDCEKQPGAYIYTYKSGGEPRNRYYCADCAKDRQYKVFGQELQAI